ncbi:hypothetical protein BDN72DRAFT_864018 [Pluteus cervinus]|uniref:Uncharacterized protein n=1 Tax=Pluteus cervinus TaxID=181527 RepID=A0ACD3A5I4_9AGAR|nr:hypothetical protein BDN72DRAFT_864018 [Pluteus cervinus]
MPKTWTTIEQKDWLHTKIPGFIDARARGRSTAYAKGVHRSFSEIWPEIDTLFKERTSTRPINLNAADVGELQAYKKKRSVQIHTWLQRNSTQRGRLANRAVKALLRNSAPRRKRAYQLGEIYNKLYPENVAAVYQERKTEDLTKGQRLNLIKKISEELLEGETEEVKALVEQEQDKRRDQLEVLAKGNGATTAELDDLTLQQYINQLPDLLTSVVGEIGKLCPEWGFLVVASGPMPKANNATHLFDLYSGPKSVEGYTFVEAHEDFDTDVRIPFGNFVEAGIVDAVKREAAKEALNTLDLKINNGDSDSEDEAPRYSPSISRRASSPASTNEQDVDEGGGEVEEIENHSARKVRRPIVADSDSDSEGDEQPPRPPPQVLPESNDPDSNADLDKFTKHPLEVWPLEQPDSDGEPEVDRCDSDDKQRKKGPRSQKNSSRDHQPESNDEVVTLQQTKAAKLAKREESTKKRLETRRINKERKDAETKALQEAEAAKMATLEAEVAMKAKLEARKARLEAEAARKAKAVEVAKKAKEAEVNTNLEEVEVAKNDKGKKAAGVYKSKASKSNDNIAAEQEPIKRVTKTSTAKKASAAKSKKGTNKGPVASKGEDTPVDDGKPHAQGDAAPVTKRRPPPAIVPPQVATPTQTTEESVPPGGEDASQAKPKAKRGRKRTLENDAIVIDAAVEAAPTKRLRRDTKAPPRADAEVSFAKKARSGRRA